MSKKPKTHIPVETQFQWREQQLFLLLRLTALTATRGQEALIPMPSGMPHSPCSLLPAGLLEPSSLYLPLQRIPLSRASWKLTFSSKCLTRYWQHKMMKDGGVCSHQPMGGRYRVRSLPGRGIPGKTCFWCHLFPRPSLSSSQPPVRGPWTLGTPPSVLSHSAVPTVPAVHGGGVLWPCRAAWTSL